MKKKKGEGISFFFRLFTIQLGLPNKKEGIRKEEEEKREDNS